MPKYSEKQVETALEEYRAHAENLLIVLRLALPATMNKIATVSDTFAFVNRIERAGNTGTMEEVFYMCDEFFSYAAQKPIDQPVYEFSIDMILRIEENPFLMVSCHDKTSDYLQRACTLEEKLPLGRILRSDKTWFLQYEESEVLSGIDFRSVEFTKDGYKIATIKRSGPKHKK